jgi:hypothetical protein
VRLSSTEACPVASARGLAGDDVQAAMALLGTIPMLRHNAERVAQLQEAGRALTAMVSQ